MTQQKNENTTEVSFSEFGHVPSANIEVGVASELHCYQPSGDHQDVLIAQENFQVGHLCFTDTG